jgi:hypothetical protein
MLDSEGMQSTPAEAPPAAAPTETLPLAQQVPEGPGTEQLPQQYDVSDRVPGPATNTLTWPPDPKFTQSESGLLVPREYEEAGGQTENVTEAVQPTTTEETPESQPTAFDRQQELDKLLAEKRSLQEAANINPEGPSAQAMAELDRQIAELSVDFTRETQSPENLENIKEPFLAANREIAISKKVYELTEEYHRNFFKVR